MSVGRASASLAHRSHWPAGRPTPPSRQLAGWLAVPQPHLHIASIGWLAGRCHPLASWHAGRPCRSLACTSLALAGRPMPSFIIVAAISVVMVVFSILAGLAGVMAKCTCPCWGLAVLLPLLYHWPVAVVVVVVVVVLLTLVVGS